MSYQPMTADEAAKLNVKPDGIYSFEVSDASDTKSKKSGDPMIALELTFYDNDGSRFSVKDWLVHSSGPKGRWAEKKFYEFALSVGLQAKYAAGQMTAEDCLGRGGYAFINTQKGQEKTNKVTGAGTGEFFPDRNGVKYYTTKPDKKPEPATPSPAKPAAKPEPLDEDVPF